MGNAARRCSVQTSCHYILDWNYDEDRCRIRTGRGPENITRLRRFAISLVKSKGRPQRGAGNARTERKHPPGLRLPPNDNKCLCAYRGLKQQRENKFTLGRCLTYIGTDGVLVVHYWAQAGPMRMAS
jgi:hypothetical protein